VSKLKSRSDVIEWYWPDYLAYCMRTRDNSNPLYWKLPTVDGFWLWYIEDGPMGVKHRNLFYTKEDVEYV
jgi:hypothetical protein